MRESFQVRKVREATIVSSCADAHMKDNASRVFTLAHELVTEVERARCVARLQPCALARGLANTKGNTRFCALHLNNSFFEKSPFYWG
jgi:hypothetical protein